MREYVGEYAGYSCARGEYGNRGQDLAMIRLHRIKTKEYNKRERGDRAGGGGGESGNGIFVHVLLVKLAAIELLVLMDRWDRLG